MASKSTKGEILAKFFDDGEYTALFADGGVTLPAAMLPVSRLTPSSRTARLFPSRTLRRTSRSSSWLPRRAARSSPSTTPSAQSWLRVWTC
mgnify:CR=1 FL=1